jgi:hypothetical protein
MVHFRSARSFRRRLTAIALAIGVATCVSACGDDKGNADTGNDTAVPVKSGGRLAWSQNATSVQQLQAMTYRLYVDGDNTSFPDVTCGQTLVAGGYECSGRLPSTTGQHTLELTAVLSGLESSRSEPLLVNFTASSALSSPSVSSSSRVLLPSTITATESNPGVTCLAEPRECYEVRAIATGLGSITSLASTPDGRVLFVEGGASVRVIANGELLSGSALTRPDPNGRIVGLAVDTGFSSTRSVFVAWTDAGSDSESRLNITRYRELQNTLGEGATIVTGLPFAEGGLAPLAVDGEGLLYVAVPAAAVSGLGTGNGLPAESGAVLRFTADGLVPASNSNASPVIAEGYAKGTGLAVDVQGRRVWLTGNDPRWSHSVSTLSIVPNSTRPWPQSPEASTLPEAGGLEAPTLSVTPNASGDARVLIGARGLFSPSLVAMGGWVQGFQPMQLDTTFSLISATEAASGSWYVATSRQDGSVSIWHVTRR